MGSNDLVSLLQIHANDKLSILERYANLNLALPNLGYVYSFLKQTVDLQTLLAPLQL
jgi:hypothetical protein